MFVELDRPPPAERMAEGAYWLFMPVGVVFTTPGLTWILALLLQQELTPPSVWILDQWQTLTLIPFATLVDVAKATLPAGWDRWAEAWAHPIAVFSFGGGAYVAAWYAAGLKRAVGWVGGFIVAVATMFALGLTFLGVLYLVLAYMIVADVRADGFILGDGNDLAIALPLLAPPALAGLLLATNALV